jgi:fructokinase
MIAVVGEALVDLIVDATGAVAARHGGAPFNAARAAARLGAPVAFLGALSTDRFGSRMAEQLVADGVDISSAPRTEHPTTLALAELDEHGSASYRFYVAGTSAPEFTRSELRPLQPTALLTGGLALVLTPMAEHAERLARTMPPEVLVMVDVNCRPALIGDRPAYTDRVMRIVERADVVKVSTEDLGVLFPGAHSDEATATLLARGARVVLVTDGPHEVTIRVGSDRVAVPVPSVEVVDTVGAGDTFTGAFLAEWAYADRTVVDLADVGAVTEAVGFAVTAAAVVCERVGADPPTRLELGR